VLQWWLRLLRVFPVCDSEPGSVFGPITGDPDPVTEVRNQPRELTANYVSELLAGISHEGSSGPASCLLAEPLEPVGKLRAAFPVVRELRDE
jgi:hypothetical protein